MLCQLCRKHPATICIASDLNGTKSQIYLCEECAKKYSLQQGNVSPDMILKLLSELSKNITAAVGGGPQIRPEDTDRVCTHCGRSYKDFVKNSFVGVPGVLQSIQRPFGTHHKRSTGDSCAGKRGTRGKIFGKSRDCAFNRNAGKVY